MTLSKSHLFTRAGITKSSVTVSDFVVFPSFVYLIGRFGRD
jgi:hypothetical protein